ncbi:MAG: hypothetical protein IPK79_05340 [Vampirovibrionales bacterium]|nr:hypothetical protein [Vampirovibrionales bacterium]
MSLFETSAGEFEPKPPENAPSAPPAAESAAQWREMEEERRTLRETVDLLQRQKQELKAMLLQRESTDRERKNALFALQTQLATQQRQLAALAHQARSSRLMKEKALAMTQPIKYPLECVTWTSAPSVVGHWRSLAAKPELLVTVSCGFITYEDDSVVQVTPHVMLAENQGCGDIQIPKAAIRARVEMDLIGDDGAGPVPEDALASS